MTINESFLYGSGDSPNIIMGRYTQTGLTSEVASVYSNTDEFDYLSRIRVNKYELWFSSNINFIPYDGSPVFTTDASGNVTHNGNLLTRRDATINGNITINSNATIDRNLQVKDDVTFDKNLRVKRDVTIDGDLLVRGNIASSNIDSLIEKVDALGDIKATIDELKSEIEKLNKEVTTLKEAAESAAAESSASEEA